MPSRTVKDSAGRSWACRQDDVHLSTLTASAPGQDVSILCTTATVSVPLRLTVGWQWTTMADNGLARLIESKSPAPRS
jgi:hypothetical protein